MKRYIKPAMSFERFEIADSILLQLSGVGTPDVGGFDGGFGSETNSASDTSSNIWAKMLAEGVQGN